MAKIYYLYLDESGDFDSDLRKKYRNECLVGGILYEAGNAMSEDKARNIIVRAWLQENPEDQKIKNPDALLKKSRHATELKEEKKAALTANVISETSKNAQIVVFENYEKTKIGDSVKTYINILVDGVVQLLKRLSVEDEKVMLNVIAGFKKDTRQEITNSMFEGYIDKQECIDMFNERFALMRAKNSGTLRSPRYSFDYADDKRTCQLILCDYICNFRFTRNKPIYRELFTKDKTYGEYIGSFYDEDNIFSIKGGTEDEKVANYLIEGGYSLALFDICAGVIGGKKRCERVFKKVAELPPTERDNVLDSLKNYIHNIVSNPYKLSQAEKVISGAETVVGWFESESIAVPKFKLDVLLYKLSVLNHSGKLVEMEAVLHETEKVLREEIIRSENLKYYFIFYNRYAVYCMDVFDFEKAGEILDKVTGVFTDYKVVLSSLPYMEMDDESIISDQYARLLGTKAQYQLRMLQQRKNGITYEDVVNTLDESIRNFRWDSDRARQYQVRADLEALCGNYSAAEEYLYKGCGVKHWKGFFQADNIKKTFSLLHLSVFVRFLSRYEDHREELLEIIKAFKANRKVLEKDGSYPEFVIAANVAEAMENLGYSKLEVSGMYKTALTADDHSPAFDLLRLIIHGGMLNNKTCTIGNEDDICIWHDRYEYVLSENIPAVTKEFLKQLPELLTANNSYDIKNLI